MKNPTNITYLCSPEVRSPRFKRSLVSQWIVSIIHSRGYQSGNICYQFCGDEEILDHNKRFLDHDYYTDIITFDETEGCIISGSMLISIDTVRSNAQLYGVPYRQELLRVIIHGVLHMTGLGDHTEEEQAEMRKAEQAALVLWNEMKQKDDQITKHRREK